MTSCLQFGEHSSPNCSQPAIFFFRSLGAWSYVRWLHGSMIPLLFRQVKSIQGTTRNKGNGRRQHVLQHVEQAEARSHAYPRPH